MLINPQYLHPCETGGVIRCGLQTRLDVGPHGVPRGCQLPSQASDGSSLEAQLSDRPADRPHTQTRPGCAHLLAVLQECHRLAGAFAAYPASLKPPDPRRDPGPGRVDHLHHHTPVALSDHPTTRAPRQLVARLNIEHQSIWGASHAHQMEALQTDEQITPITTIKRHGAAAGRVRHCRGPLKIAGVEVRSSSRTSTSTRNPRPTPTHPHSTRKSRYCAPGKAHFRRGCPRQASRPPCRGLGSRRPDQVAGRRGDPTRRAVLQALFRIGVGNRSFGQVGNLPQ